MGHEVGGVGGYIHKKLFSFLSFPKQIDKMWQKYVSQQRRIKCRNTLGHKIGDDKFKRLLLTWSSLLHLDLHYVEFPQIYENETP